MQVMSWSFTCIKIRQTIYLAIIMPNDVAEEKMKALSSLGADIEKVKPASIVDKKQVSFFRSINICLRILLRSYSTLWVPWLFMLYGVIYKHTKNLARQRADEFGQKVKADNGLNKSKLEQTPILNVFFRIWFCTSICIYWR